MWWYIRCQSTSGWSGSAPIASGFSAACTVAAAISGGCRPWQSASPQPVTPSSVVTSTMVAPRLATQPCENANGCASGERRTCARTSVIFTVQLSTFAPAALTTGGQRSISTLMNAVNASGDALGVTSSPAWL